MVAQKKTNHFFYRYPLFFGGEGRHRFKKKENVMEENSKEIIEKTLISKERTDETPEVQTVETSEAKNVETPEAEITDTPTPAEKKQTTRRRAARTPKLEAAAADKDASKKEASPEAKKEASLPRLKASLRHGFQFKGHYYSRAELGRKNVLAGLWKKYPGLFEK